MLLVDSCRGNMDIERATHTHQTVPEARAAEFILWCDIVGFLAPPSPPMWRAFGSVVVKSFLNRFSGNR